MRIAFAGSILSSACGGAEFGAADPTLNLDASADAKPPSSDGNTSGGGGAAGSGGSSGTTTSGGAGGTSGPGGTGGSGGTGGAGASGGAAGTGGSGGGSGIDGGKSDGPKDGPGANDVTSIDQGALDVSDASIGDAVTDGIPRADVDSGDAADALGDGPTTSDAKDADSSSDARIDGPISDAACSEPVTYFKDQDGDGFGDDGNTILSCTLPPGNTWSVLGGDCRDDLPNVKPFSVGQPNPPLYSGTGYADVGGPQGVSFDYDCSGGENADPSNAYGPSFDCAGLLNCKGAGYLPVNPSRTGPGIDPRCGSTTLQRCTGTVVCSATIEITTEPYRCR